MLTSQKKDFVGVLSTGKIDNVVCAKKCTVSDERENDRQDSTVLTAARTAGAECKVASIHCALELRARDPHRTMLTVLNNFLCISSVNAKNL